MGFMGFGMRKEVYQRKPNKFSVEARYKKNETGKSTNEKIDFSSHRYSTPLAVKIVRVVIYKLVPLSFLLFLLYHMLL